MEGHLEDEVSKVDFSTFVRCTYLDKRPSPLLQLVMDEVFGACRTCSRRLLALSAEENETGLGGKADASHIGQRSR